MDLFADAEKESAQEEEEAAVKLSDWDDTDDKGDFFASPLDDDDDSDLEDEGDIEDEDEEE